MKKIDFIIVILFISFMLFILCGCMINDDYHIHKLELHTDTGVLLVDDVDSGEITYKISPDNIGITFYIDEPIDNFTWHFNTLNNEGVRYEIRFKDDGVFVAHNFNRHPQLIFKATTYLVESHYHFITNLN